jgi:hypothetical protein
MNTILTQSYLYKAGLLQFNGLNIINEMSDKVIDVLASDDGLEVAKKSKIKGLLSPGNWSLLKIEYLEGPHGEPNYETCENCKKSIRYVCTIMDDDEKIVGPDCALTLLPPGSKDAKEVENYIGRRVSRNKFVKNALKLFETAIEPSEDEKKTFRRLKSFYDNGTWKKSNVANWIEEANYAVLNKVKTAKAIVDELYKYKPIGLVSSNDDQKSDVRNLSTLAAKIWIKEILSDKVKELSKSFEHVFDEGINLRDKKYFFDPKSNDYISGFLFDEESLLKTKERSIWDIVL